MLALNSCNNVVSNQSSCLFELGQIDVSPGVFSLSKDEGLNLDTFLDNHKRGAWGQIDKLDAEANEVSLEIGGQLFSSFFIGDEFSASDIWLITNSDRSLTRIMLPDEFRPAS